MMDDALLVEAAESLAARGDPEGAAEAEVMLAFIWWVRGSRDRMAEHLERARSLVEEAPASPAKAHVLSDLSRSRMLAGEFQASVEIGREAMAMAEALGLDLLAARILCTIGTSRSSLGEPSGIDDLQRSIQLASEMQSLHVQWTAVVNLATIFFEWGELDRIPPLYEDAIIRTGGSESDRRWTLCERAILAYHLGDWMETKRLIEAFEAGAGTPHYMDFAVLDLRARFALARGAPEEALEASAREVELTREIADPQALLVSLGTRVKCLREAGRIDEARPLADEVLEWWRASDALSGITAALDVAWTWPNWGRRRTCWRSSTPGSGARGGSTPPSASCEGSRRCGRDLRAHRLAPRGGRGAHARGRAIPRRRSPAIRARAAGARLLSPSGRERSDSQVRSGRMRGTDQN